MADKKRPKKEVPQPTEPTSIDPLFEMPYLVPARAKEHLRAVVWPREPRNGIYRYVIVGMLVTDRPIEGLEGFNETILDDRAAGMSAVLAGMPKRENDRGWPIGDASEFLVSLEELKTKLRGAPEDD